jgi:hypothetical protein
MLDLARKARRGIHGKRTANVDEITGNAGRREEARELLAPVYGWFKEGFDTLDLTGAKALLNELHA